MDQSLGGPDLGGPVSLEVCGADEILNVTHQLVKSCLWAKANNLFIVGRRRDEVAQIFHNVTYVIIYSYCNIRYNIGIVTQLVNYSKSAHTA